MGNGVPSSQKPSFSQQDNLRFLFLFFLKFLHHRRFDPKGSIQVFSDHKGMRPNLTASLILASFDTIIVKLPDKSCCNQIVTTVPLFLGKYLNFASLDFLRIESPWRGNTGKREGKDKNQQL